MKRIVFGISFSLFCIGLLVVQYCFFKDSPTPFQKPEKIARISLISEPLSLDSRKSTDAITSQFFNFISDGLTRRSFNGEIVLSLAKEVEISEDKLTYTFLLKEAYWSNGELITTIDFENSWKRILDPEFMAYNPDYLFSIKNAKKAYEGLVDIDEIGVKSLDNSRLQVTLEYPDPFFLELLANKTFFPINHKIDKKHPNWSDFSLKYFVSCGPFVIKKWLPRNKIVLRKNPYYWDEQNVHLEGVDLYHIEDEMTQLSMYENGELDWIGAPLSMLPVEALSKLRHSSEFGSYQSSSLYYCCFNNECFPLNHPKIRKALSLAINRRDLIQHVSQGGEQEALALLPKSMYAKHREYFKDGDLEESRRLFQEALNELNLNTESFPVLTFSFPNIHCRRVLAQAIQQQWEKALGIKVLLKSCEWQVFLSDVKKQNYQISCLGRGTHHLDPIYFLGLFERKTKETNFPKWQNFKYTQLLEQIRHIHNPEKRKKFVALAEKIFMDEMPIAPIFFPSNYFLKSSNLQNVLVSPVGSLDFKWAYFD